MPMPPATSTPGTESSPVQLLPRAGRVVALSGSPVLRVLWQDLCAAQSDAALSSRMSYHVYAEQRVQAFIPPPDGEICICSGH